jgi:DNA/RNA-binding domain of Phe-tRNA-synthetase-like protein
LRKVENEWKIRADERGALAIRAAEHLLAEWEAGGEAVRAAKIERAWREFYAVMDIGFSGRAIGNAGRNRVLLLTM